MVCADGLCTETCSGGSAACGSMTCGAGQCLATCQGSGAGADSSCGAVSCASSCQCDVECDGVTNICPASMTCPAAPMQEKCTETGADGDRCDADFKPQCKSC
jgi:hypothetical protein